MKVIATFVLCLLSTGALTAAATRSPALLVLNKDDNALAIVDPVSGKVAARVPTGVSPHELTVSSDGKFAFVANYGGDTISIIDLAAQKELRQTNLASLHRPHGIAFAGGRVYFTAEANQMIARYDPAADRVDWTYRTGQDTTHMIVISKDLSTIFTSNIGSDTISIIQRASPAGVWKNTAVRVGSGPEAIDLSPDEKEVWTAHSGDGGISIIDVATKRVSHSFNIGTKRTNRLKFTPNGKVVLISDMGAGELIVVDRAARKGIKRLKLGRSPEGILIAPDGSRAYVGVTGDNNIAVVDMNTLTVTGRISPGNGPDGMAWAERR